MTAAVRDRYGDGFRTQCIDPVTEWGEIAAQVADDDDNMRRVHYT